MLYVQFHSGVVLGLHWGNKVR